MAIITQLNKQSANKRESSQMAEVLNNIKQLKDDKDNNEATAFKIDEKEALAIISRNDYYKGTPTVDNEHPNIGLRFLMPISISELSINDLPKDQIMSTTKLLKEAEMIGFTVSEYPLTLYSSSIFGRMRRLNNSELVIGYPMYGSTSDPLSKRLDSLRKTRDMLISFTKNAEEFIQRNAPSEVYQDEKDDFERLTILRTQYFGRHLNLPASVDEPNQKYPKRLFEIMEIIAKHYASLANNVFRNRDEAIRSLIDARETAVGMPSGGTGGIDELGYDYHQKRVITLLDTPTPDYDMLPSDYLAELYRWGEELGLPNGSMTLASLITFRQGAKGHKPQPLWYHNGSEFVATKEAYSWESNQRLTYPASFVVNFILGPITAYMKAAQKRKLGMYHTPEFAMRYVPQLQKQGPYSYESDFSTYDKTMGNSLMVAAMRMLGKYSKFSWEFEFAADYLQTTGAIFPSFHQPSVESVTYFEGGVSLLSGWIFTSALGTFISMAANLYCLEQQFPTIVNDWLNNKFIALVQSDDYLFTSPKKLDEEMYAERMSTCHLKTKLKPGMMFLKKLLPVGPLKDMKGPINGVPLISRQPQQTFFNEADYTGKPDAIMRLALMSRIEGLNYHPYYVKHVRQEWEDIISSFEMFKPLMPILYDGPLAMSEDDKRAIIEYAESDKSGSWLAQLMSRAEADPKSAALLEDLRKSGVDFSKFTDDSEGMRLQYLQALRTTPTDDSRRRLLSICKWNRPD